MSSHGLNTARWFNILFTAFFYHVIFSYVCWSQEMRNCLKGKGYALCHCIIYAHKPIILTELLKIIQNGRWSSFLPQYFLTVVCWQKSMYHTLVKLRLVEQSRWGNNIFSFRKLTFEKRFYLKSGRKIKLLPMLIPTIY